MIRRVVCGVLCAVLCPLAAAADVGLSGVLGKKAVLVVNGKAPRAFSVGQTTPDGVRVVEVGPDSAVIEVNGVRQMLRMGEHVVQQGTESKDAQIFLEADAQGHFYTQGLVNGRPVRMLVDTGATLVVIGMSDALSAGIDPERGQPIRVQTANGIARAWQIKLDTLRVGDITLHNVEAAVHENSMPTGLLGMSFLNRMEMNRQGNQLIFKRRY